MSRARRDPSILVVAKPWRGGLGRYLLAALREMFPGRVEWLALYPDGIAARLAYVRDRERWRARITERVARADHDAVVFVNRLPDFSALPARDRHVLWMTDAAEVATGSLDPFGRVFVSDPGYAASVESRVASGRFAGVLPFAHLPALHTPARAPEAPSGACLLGNRDPKRDAHLRVLLEAGYRPTVVGNHFVRSPLFWAYPECFHPPVRNAAMGAVYARHRVSLNVHAGVVRGGTNMRTFECAGYGIAQLVEFRPGLESLFDPGAEIAVYREPGELPGALARLLRDAPGCARIAERARARALGEHRYQHRAAVMLEGLVPADRLARWRRARP